MKTYLKTMVLLFLITITLFASGCTHFEERTIPNEPFIGLIQQKEQIATPGKAIVVSVLERSEIKDEEVKND